MIIGHTNYLCNSVTFWRFSSHGAIATIGHPAQESQAIRRGHGLAAAVLNRVLQCTAPNKGGEKVWKSDANVRKWYKNV